MQTNLSTTNMAPPATRQYFPIRKSISKAFVNMYGKHNLRVSICKSVHAQIWDIRDGMEPGVSYTLREICGEEYWLGLKTKGNCCKAGMWIAAMVRKNKLPLKFAGKRGSTWLYVLADVSH